MSKEDREFRRKQKEASQNWSDLLVNKPRAKKIRREVSDYLERRGGK